MTGESLLRGAALYLGLLLLLFLAARLLPGPRRLGQPLADGSRKEYKLTGLTLFLLTHLAVLGLWLGGGSLSVLLDHFWEMFLTANAVSLLGAVALYWQGRARGERGRGAAWDFAMGLQLNPDWLGVDLKMFAYQPSLILLGLLVASFAFAQHERLGLVTPQMWLYQAMWWIYLLTHYLREKFLLQIWDVIAERFGLALLWGDLVLVPFFYCIAGFTLVEQREPLPAAALIGIAALYLAGLLVFRVSNAQKNRFKADPRARIWGRPAEALQGRLLVSGFWGLGRHLNYTGEIAAYVAIALTAGFAEPWPYLLPLWLLGLLSHRALRDERRCRAKYGALWDRYCERARFRMFPFLY